MSEYVVKTLESGQYRAQVILDDDAGDMPDGDYFGTVYSLYRDGSVETLGASSRCDPGLGDVIGAVWRDTHDMDAVEAVLRGKLNTCAECGSDLIGPEGEAEACPSGYEDTDLHVPSYDHEPVVGFDYIDTDAHKIINVVNFADLKAWGFESVEAYREQAGNADPASDNLTEWRAWAAGEVYYVRVERRVAVRTITADLTTGDTLQDDSTEEWSEVYGCHGYFGVEFATEVAAEELGHYAARGAVL